jgi:Mrp family chromosome partitioning ATPase
LDKIKIAMELARARQAGSRPGVPPRVAAVDDDLPEPAQIVRARTRSVPVDEATLSSNLVLLPGAGDGPAQSYKMLRTRVMRLLRDHQYRSLAVVSPAAEDGRTLTAINLAVTLSEDPDHTVLLVDMDLRQPSIHRYFGLKPDLGVADCLRNSRDVADVLVRPEPYPKLVLLPGVKSERQSSELLSGAKARQMTTELRERYENRIVIYDLPPLLATDDTIAFLPCVEAALLVVCEGHTRREDVARGLELLGGTPLVGTVLNGSRASFPAPRGR